MSWIESHTELRNHPKTERLMRMLRISRVEAVGHLHMLWWWCWNYAHDGDLSRWDALDLAIAAEWPGDADEFVAALRAVGFLEGCDERTLIHDWDTWSGKQRKRLDAKAAAMRSARADKAAAASQPPQQEVLPEPTEPAAEHSGDHVVATFLPRGRHVALNRTGPDRTGPNQTEPETHTANNPERSGRARARARESSGFSTDNATNPTLAVHDPERLLLTARLKSISQEFDDDRPASSVTRVQHFMHAHGLDGYQVDNALKEAHHQTRKRVEDPDQRPVGNRMAYFLGLVEKACKARAPSSDEAPAVPEPATKQLAASTRWRQATHSLVAGLSSAVALDLLFDNRLDHIVRLCQEFGRMTLRL